MTDERAYGPQDLKHAIDVGDVPCALAAFMTLTGWSVADFALYPGEGVLYAAGVVDGVTSGLCAYVNDALEMIVVRENDGPLFVGAPGSLIEKLDATFNERAVRWRRDCLVRHYRDMAVEARIGHPAWTVYYSPEPLGAIKFHCHYAVVIAGAPRGQQELAITDGTGWRTITVPVSQLAPLRPLWALEWSTDAHLLMAMRGRSAARYIGIGPPDYRVGLLFNDLGGLLGWSAAATHCELMATAAQVEESGFSRMMLLTQLSQWSGRATTV